MNFTYYNLCTQYTSCHFLLIKIIEKKSSAQPPWSLTVLAIRLTNSLKLLVLNTPVAKEIITNAQAVLAYVSSRVSNTRYLVDFRYFYKRTASVNVMCTKPLLKMDKSKRK